MNLLKATSSPASPATAWLHYNKRYQRQTLSMYVKYSKSGPQNINSYGQLDNTRIFAGGRKKCYLLS